MEKTIKLAMEMIIIVLIFALLNSGLISLLEFLSSW